MDRGGSGSEESVSTEVTVEDVLDRLEELEGSVSGSEQRREVRRTRGMIEGLRGGRVFGQRIERYTTRDVAESFVGSVIISLPLLVEDGVFDIADHFAESIVYGIPIFFVANALFVLVLTAGLLYWADIQQVTITNPVLGVVPRRFLGVVVISFLTASITMTLWGRVENWEDPLLAIYRISVIWTAAAFGAALGDILPGQSGGRDIGELVAGNDDPGGSDGSSRRD